MFILSLFYGLLLLIPRLFFQLKNNFILNIFMPITFIWYLFLGGFKL